MERILIGAESEVFVGHTWPRPLLEVRADRRKVAILSQPGAEEMARVVGSRLDEEGLEGRIHILPDGDEAKTLGAIGIAYQWLAENEISRGDTLMGVGGGAVTDAAGFIAGTWMRGIEAVHVPTTLLGAVDASIGGKAGINVAGKNLVGVFWHPSRVLVDLALLERLPAELKRQGAAEIIKAGLLARPAIVDAYRSRGLEVDLAEVVPAAIRIKTEIVSEDFKERDRRVVLNLGHTIGHGIEFASNLSHGESVALGLVAEAAVAERLLGFAGNDDIREALTAAGLPTVAPSLDRDEVMRLIGLDKKKVAGALRMVLLEAPGRPVVREVEPADVEWGLAAIGL
ncbi:MAG TPA: 3-dehydroquinate synthase family protein [Acidimicrobiia bacterium]|nr:3-dehydroquinate synthase family protein [Acidimicrobiia bacterium]